MSLSRYTGKEIIINKEEAYEEILDERGVKEIRQYESTPIHLPTPTEIMSITYETRRWKSTDRLYKLASEFYSDPGYWWVIAQFNQKPTESHFKIGDVYYIPLSIEQILEYYRI